MKLRPEAAEQPREWRSVPDDDRYCSLEASFLRNRHKQSLSEISQQDIPRTIQITMPLFQNETFEPSCSMLTPILHLFQRDSCIEPAAEGRNRAIQWLMSIQWIR